MSPQLKGRGPRPLCERDTYVPLDTMSVSNQKKVILLGDGAVGKTCFFSRATENKYIPSYLPTLGGEISYIQLVTYNDPSTICEGQSG